MNTLKRSLYAGAGLMLTAHSALAAIDFGEERVSEELRGTDGGSPVETLQKYISYATNFLYLVLVLMALWGGWKILTSGAEDEGKEAGKKIIVNAAIGLVVIFFASTIASLVINFLSQSLN